MADENKKQVEGVSRLEATATLAGGVAHHVNNYMAVIIGSTDLLLEEQLTEIEQEELLQTIGKAAKEAAQLARHLLEFAQGGRLLPKSLNLNEIIRNVVHIRSVDFPAGVSTKLLLTENLHSCKGDERQINELVVNLLNNALDAVGASGEITFSSENMSTAEGDFIKLIVRDNGCGMTDEVKQRAFEPFFTTNMTGRGLGLAACHGIVTGHGGTIDLESTTELGTVFRVLLPKDGEEVKAAIKAPEAVATKENPTVLVVDDHVSVTKTTAFLLKRKGYNVFVAFDGQEALEVVESVDDIDVVLIDLAMPVLGGEAAINEIRKLRPALPIIVCSARGTVAKIHSLEELKVAGYLEKPYKADDLLTEIRKAVKS